MLPDGWRVMPLGQLATLERGRFSARPRNDPQFFGGSVPFVQTGDVANAGLMLKSYSQTLNERGVRVSKVFPPGTILMTIAANIGATAITEFPVACPDSLVGICPLDGISENYWLHYALLARKSELDGMAGQNAQKNINLQVLDPFQIVAPPFIEQQRISNVLRTWDSAISLSEKLLVNAHRQMQDLRVALLSVRLNPIENVCWKYCDLGDEFERVSQKNSIGNENVLTISGQHGLISQRDYFNKSVASENLQGYTLLQRGDFAYNKSYSIGYPMGAIKPLIAYDAGVVSSLYLCFRLKPGGEADHDFFRHYFEAGMLNEEITGIAQEGARNHGLLNVSVVDFFKLRMHVPDLTTQRRIAEILNTAEAQERVIAAQIDKLKEEKRALMADLLTGKRRVRLPEAEEATP